MKIREMTKNSWNILAPISSDMSPRKYSRVQKNAKIAILMDCAGPQAPGHDMGDFARIAEWLRGVGLRAPKIYERGEDYLVIEDFGDVSFREFLKNGADARAVYGVAVDVLKCFNDENFINSLPDYYQSHVHKGRRRIIDWYAPQIFKQKNADGLVETYIDVWDGIENSLPPCAQGFIHGDFHLDNLMAIAGGQGTDMCGILDFQGAMRGPIPYDLVNLLEDARADVPESIRKGMIMHFCADMNARDTDIFRAWYRVLGTQFHCRAIGQFIKMALNGKPQYLPHIPRVQRYIREALSDPILMPLKVFFNEIGLDFEAGNHLIGGIRAELIREDAF